MLNKVILQGNIGRAPKVFLTQEGKEIATFSLATSTSWKDKSGEWQKSTNWHRITVFRQSTIGWIKDILKRGDPVYVEGKLSYHRWTDKFGQERATPHVMVTGREGRIEHFLSSKVTSEPLVPRVEDQTAASDELPDIPLEIPQEGDSLPQNIHP